MTTPMRKLGRSIQVGEMSICQIIIILSDFIVFQRVEQVWMRAFLVHFCPKKVAPMWER
jgi:hypothetical protein